MSAPQVTIDYDRAVEMRRQQSEAYWNGRGPTVVNALIGIALVLLLPAGVGLERESWVGFWLTLGIEVAVLGIAILIGRAQNTDGEGGAG